MTILTAALFLLAAVAAVIAVVAARRILRRPSRREPIRLDFDAHKGRERHGRL